MDAFDGHRLALQGIVKENRMASRAAHGSCRNMTRERPEIVTALRAAWIRCDVTVPAGVRGGHVAVGPAARPVNVVRAQRVAGPGPDLDRSRRRLPERREARGRTRSPRIRRHRPAAGGERAHACRSPIRGQTREGRESGERGHPVSGEQTTFRTSCWRSGPRSTASREHYMLWFGWRGRIRTFDLLIQSQ
jgi:hypothetical protein